MDKEKLERLKEALEKFEANKEVSRESADALRMHARAFRTVASTLNASQDTLDDVWKIYSDDEVSFEITEVIERSSELYRVLEETDWDWMGLLGRALENAADALDDKSIEFENQLMEPGME